MVKKVQIYKMDKWNMMTVEVKGKKIILREISDQWGEETHTFISRPEMMNMVEQRFPTQDYIGNESEWHEIMNTFSQI